MKLTESRRRLLFRVSLAAAAVAAIGLVSNVASALPAGTPAAGVVTVTPATGNSDTEFAFAFASDQTCPGDTNGGYLWGTFITPRTTDPATLTFDGPGSPLGDGFTAALRDPIGDFIRGQAPNLMDFLIFPPNAITFAGPAFAGAPAGEYWIGIACSLNFETVKFWATPIILTATAGAGPNNFTYVVDETVVTTTTTTTTTTAATTTTTTVAGTTTTTVASGVTTSSVPGTTTTTTIAAGSGASAGSTGSGSSASGGSPSGASGTLPSTGWSPMAFIVWGLLLVVFGRMAILFGRRPKVIPVGES